LIKKTKIKTKMEVSKIVNIRFLNTREDKKDKIIRVALVSDIVDSYDTIIEPTGCKSPIDSVPVDYMHNRISTECTMENDKIETIKIRNAGGEEIEIEALCVDVRVPQNARKYTNSNRDLKADEVPSLYDTIGTTTRWGSVDFEPLKVIREYDKNNNLILERYPEWRLNFFSLLDTKPGQDTSFFLNVRSKFLDNQNQKPKENMSKYKAEETIRIINEIKIDKVETVNDQSIYTVRIGETELVLDENSIATLQTPIEAKYTNRAYSSACVKRKSDGILGVVTKTIKEQNTEGLDIETVTILTTNGDTLIVDGSKVSWDVETESEWVYAEMGDLLAYMITAEKGETNRSKKEDIIDEEITENQRLQTEIETLKVENLRYKKLANSPIETPGKRADRASVDMEGDGADNDSEDSDTRSLDDEYSRILASN
jgi:hypothetical protein